MSTPIENNTEELQTILQTVNNLPNLGGSGSSDVFIVHVTMDEDWENIVTVDKTYEEIAEAVNSGKVCFLERHGTVFLLEYCNTEYGCRFVFCGDDYTETFFFSIEGDTDYDYDFVVTPDTIYRHSIPWLTYDGEVVSDIISDEYTQIQLHNSFSQGRIHTYFTVFNTEIYTPISYEAFADITRIVSGASEAYYLARVFVKDGYLGISFYEEYENEMPIIRWEASFTKTA